VGDRIASAADPSLLAAVESDQPYFDRSYGHTWSFTPKPGAAVYGRTEAFAPAPLDHLAGGRFLRVPFRRIPVIDVGSTADLAALAARIVSGDASIHLMWRGQTRGYYLDRPEEDQLRLFGSTAVREPSLVPSAARSKMEFSQVFPPWAAILDAYLSGRAHSLPRSDSRRAELAGFHSSYRYRLWAFATAQHYGLPSVGLDVTTDLWTAVLFALHEFRFDEATGVTSFSRVGPDAEPVLYAMGGFQNDLFDDEKLAPGWMQCERPKAQTAHFFGTGWGAAANKAAERIFMVLRLVNHATWALPKTVKQLFPAPEEDPLLDFLLRARERFPEVAREARLHRVYHVP